MDDNHHTQKDTRARIKVWDLPIRLFHWLLVIAFCLSAYSAFQDKFGIYATMHIWSGFAVIVLVSWRIVWGLVGSDTARFTTFIKSPLAALAYLKTMRKKQSKSPIGHNPLGGYSVMLMLVILLAQAIIGLFGSDSMFFEGPLAYRVGDLAGDITDIHEILGLFLIGLVSLHITMVLLYRLVKKTNLIMPMISGHMLRETLGEKPLKFRSSLLALFLLLPVGGLSYYLIF